MCVLHSVERHCVCTAQCREALCVLHSLERHCVCVLHSIERHCVYCTNDAIVRSHYSPTLVKCRGVKANSND